MVYFEGTAEGKKITATDKDSFERIFKKALDLEFYPGIMVDIDHLHTDPGELPAHYILIVRHGYETEYVNSAPFWKYGYYDILFVSRDTEMIEKMRDRTLARLLSLGFTATGDEGEVKVADEGYEGYSVRFSFVKRADGGEDDEGI